MFPKLVLPPDHKLTITERVGGDSYYLVIDDPLDSKAANPEEVKAWYDSTIAKRMANMSDLDPDTADRINELETRIRTLETLFGMIAGDLLGQVSFRGETLTEIAAMNRRALGNVVDDVVAETELPIEEASRKNLLAFAKELNVPESALPTTPVGEEVLRVPGSESLNGPAD